MGLMVLLVLNEVAQAAEIVATFETKARIFYRFTDLRQHGLLALLQNDVRLIPSPRRARPESVIHRMLRHWNSLSSASSTEATSRLWPGPGT